MVVKKADLAEHLEKECKYRLETCGFCKMQISLTKMQVLSGKKTDIYMYQL